MGAEPTGAALARVYAQAERLGVSLAAIPGTTRPERVDENLAALEISLDAETLGELDPLGDLVVDARYA